MNSSGTFGHYEAIEQRHEKMFKVNLVWFKCFQANCFPQSFRMVSGNSESRRLWWNLPGNRLWWSKLFGKNHHVSTLKSQKVQLWFFPGPEPFLEWKLLVSSGKFPFTKTATGADSSWPRSRQATELLSIPRTDKGVLNKLLSNCSLLLASTTLNGKQLTSWHNTLCNKKFSFAVQRPAKWATLSKFFVKVFSS